MSRWIGTASKEAFGGRAVDAECYTGEGKREEEARQLDDRWNEAGLGLTIGETERKPLRGGVAWGGIVQ